MATRHSCEHPTDSLRVKSTPRTAALPAVAATRAGLKECDSRNPKNRVARHVFPRPRCNVRSLVSVLCFLHRPNQTIDAESRRRLKRSYCAPSSRRRNVIFTRPSNIWNSDSDDPSYGPAYIVFGDVYNSEGLFDDAMRALNYGAAVSPPIWQTYAELARASIGKGQYQQGLQFARRAEQLLGKSLASLYLLKVYAMIPLKLYQDATKELQTYLKQEPRGKHAEEANRLLGRLQAMEVATPSAAAMTVPRPQ
jgi:tetratricopeptide (TPR) repeat protein